MSILTVGSGKTFSTINAAVTAARDGDVIRIDAGTYYDDLSTITKKLTLQGVGGFVRMDSTHDLNNDKGYFVTQNDVSFDHFEFTDAVGGSGNAAGIRHEAGNLVVTNSYFHHNQNGILTNPNPTATVTLKNSEFAYNGAENGGYGTHNIYIGDIAKLTMDNCYVHDITNQYNQIKSRAAETIITNTRVLDLRGNASYEIDIPNGGKTFLAFNTIQQGVGSKNASIVNIGAEGLTHANTSLTMVNNTIANEIQGQGLLVLNPEGVPVLMYGNKVWMVDYLEMPEGRNIEQIGTTYLQAEPTFNTAHPWTGVDPLPPASLPNLGGKTWNGTKGGDIYYAGRFNDIINGGDGNDELSGMRGDDLLRGGNGNDTVCGDRGDDTINTGAGRDVIWLQTDGGHDLVTLFQDGYDKFNISDFNMATVNFRAEVQIVDTKDGALMSLGDDVQVLVLGIRASQLTTADFIFV